MTYRETIETLYNMMPDFQAVGAGAYKPGLERVDEFLNLLGRPYERFESIHVAGTNGKGSCSHMIAAVLQADKHRVGLYTSPHLCDFRERMRINGTMISEREVVDFVDKHLETMRTLGLSFFEVTMCMAFDWFERREVDVAVVEVGLGGRLDATNIIIPRVSVITNIGLDHQQFLGDTLTQIAAEKAGIITAGIPVVIGEHSEETDPVFRSVAAREGAPMLFAQEMYDVRSAGKGERRQRFAVERLSDGVHFNVELDLLGDYQARNLTTALGALKIFGVSPLAVREGLAGAAVATGLRGRWEVLGRTPLVVADTAHNAHGLAPVMEQLMRERRGRLFVVFGMVADKDVDAILPLLPRDAYYLFTAPASPRALDAAELGAHGIATGLRGEVVGSAPDALARARELASPSDTIYIGGSNYIVAEIL